LCSPDIDQPDWNTFSKHWDTEKCSRSGMSCLFYRNNIGIFAFHPFQHIVDMHGLAIENRPSSRVSWCIAHELRSWRGSERCYQSSPVTLNEPNLCISCLAESGGICCDSV